MRPPAKEVRAVFDACNRAFFGGVLRPAIHWRRMADYGRCYEPSGKYPFGLILLSSDLTHDPRWDEILLHELVHCFLDVMYPNTDEYHHGRVAYHGPAFRDECNRVGRLIGLPEVDEEHCWAWPYCVRYAEHPEPAREE